MLLTVIQTERMTDPERVCDIKDCRARPLDLSNSLRHHYRWQQNECREIRDFKIEEFALVAICPHHYKEMMSEEGLDKAFDMKDNVYAQTEGIHN